MGLSTKFYFNTELYRAYFRHSNLKNLILDNKKYQLVTKKKKRKKTKDKRD